MNHFIVIKKLNKKILDNYSKMNIIDTQVLMLGN